MPAPRLWPFECFEKQNLPLYARIVGDDNQIVLSSDTGLATDLRVYDVTADPSTDIYNGANPAATSPPFYTALQTGGSGWDYDDDGFNFFFVVAHSALEVALIGGHQYRIELDVTTDDDGTIPVVWEGTVHSLRG